MRRFILENRISLRGTVATGDLKTAVPGRPSARDPLPVGPGSRPTRPRPDRALPGLRAAQGRAAVPRHRPLVRHHHRRVHGGRMRGCQLIRLEPQPAPSELYKYYPRELLVRSRRNHGRTTRRNVPAHRAVRPRPFRHRALSRIPAKTDPSSTWAAAAGCFCACWPRTACRSWDMDISLRARRSCPGM